ncbi:unnamed protein product [Closterium sp. NIES-54]
MSPINAAADVASLTLRDAVISLLRCFWAIIALPVILALLPLPALAPLRYLMRILAGRGITQRGSTSKPVKSLAPSKFASLRHMTVPHRWFSHFYIVGFALNLALLALALTAPSHLTTLLSTELPTGFSDITSSSKGSNGSSNYSSNNSSSESTVTSTPDITATSSVQALQLLLHRVPFHYYIAAPLSFFLTGRPALPSTAADVTSIACLIAGVAVFAWGNIHQHRCHAMLVRSSLHLDVPHCTTTKCLQGASSAFKCFKLE